MLYMILGEIREIRLNDFVNDVEYYKELTYVYTNLRNK